MSVPSWPFIVSYVCVLICHSIFNFFEIYWFLISAFIFALLYFVVKKVSHDKLGVGDVYFGIFQGLCIFPQYIWICLCFEVIFAAIYFAFKKSKKIAFIPFMSIGLLIAYIFNNLKVF